jgi:metal-responsive CopG/Arc/MetJ family transcriptional regulator
MKEVSSSVNDRMAKEIDKLIEDNEGVWSSRSHFIRCAIIQFLRQHRTKNEEVMNKGR